MTARPNRHLEIAGPPTSLIVACVVAMPFLAGIPRGALLPMLRPSEALQLAVTAAAVALGVWAWISGRRWRLAIGPVDWWLLATAVAGSMVPLLWLLARSKPVGVDQVLAAFPLVKFAALYVLVRTVISSERDVTAVVRGTTGAALIISVIAITQALGVGPVIDLLGRFFVSSTEDVVDGGRGTTTIGSSIATGAYLAVSAGLALSVGLASGRRRWFAAAGFVTAGALASGQAGTVLALGVVLLTIAWAYRRSAQLLAWSIPAGAVGVVVLWPILSARLADIDAGTGLPESWVIRWSNISELYLPSLIDGGWVLGVNPDAVVAPPDVFRTTVYLESGYLWLLWVGGLPLLVAAVGFLLTSWRALALDGPDGRVAADGSAALTIVDAVRIAARAAVAMVMVLSLIDPHLTLRAGADLLFVLLALGLTGAPLVVPLGSPSQRWRALLWPQPATRRHVGARIQLAEAPKGPAGNTARTVPTGNGSGSRPEAEMTLVLAARSEGRDIAATTLALFREQTGLRGELIEPVSGIDREAEVLVWRAVALAGRSLRLIELSTGTDRHDRAALKLAARLAENLEIERVAKQSRPDPSIRRAIGSGDLAEDELPGIRFDVDVGVPRWKRAVDLGVGSVALVATAPLWLLSAFLVKRSSAGPVLYRQVRIGTGGLPFQIYKFRTMYLDNDDSAHRLQNRLELRGEAEAAKDEADPRVTPIGRLLRRLSLDELPQLLNVVRSEMSLVGPRPSLVWESELFQPPARRRLVTRPGLTGLWQIGGRADVSMAEMLELDLEYVNRMSPLVDLHCLAKTATSVVAGRGAR